MKPHASLLCATITACAVIAAVPVNAALVADWNASTDTTGDFVWEDEVGSNDLEFVSTTGGAAADDIDLVGSAYSFPASGGSNPAIGAYKNGAYFQSLDVMTIDVLFRVATTSQKAVLFSTGGIVSGTSISYDNGLIRFLLKDGNANNDSKINLAGTIDADETTQFVRASVTINGTSDEVFLYVDGLEVGSSTAVTFGDFTGSRQTLVGMRADQIGGADGNGGGSDTDDFSSWDAGIDGKSRACRSTTRSSRSSQSRNQVHCC